MREIVSPSEGVTDTAEGKTRLQGALVAVMHLPTFGRWAENAGNRLTFGRWNWYGGRENAAARGSGGSDASTHLRKVGGKCGKSPHLRKVGEPTTGVCAWMCYRNGTESRNLLPLWKEDGVAIPFRKLLEMALQERRNRNGTESRDLLPLWEDDTGKGMPQITVRRPSRPDAVPDGGQRSG